MLKELYMSCALSNDVYFSLIGTPVHSLREVERYSNNLLRLCNLGPDSHHQEVSLVLSTFDHMCS